MALSASLFVNDATLADQPSEPLQPKYGWREVWAGADATKDVWLLYSGVTLAPWSDDIYSDGWRVRVTSGYGQYHYDAQRAQQRPCGEAGVDACKYVQRRFNVDYSYADLLVGYHVRFGQLTAKAFAGVTMASHDFDQPDPLNKVSGRDIGPKAAVEFWLNLGERAWTSLDLSYTTAHDTGSARWRAGWRVMPSFSIGPEARFDSNTEDSAGRVGLFARYDWLGGEISLAAGGAGSDLGDTAQDLAPYATLNMLLQY